MFIQTSWQNLSGSHFWTLLLKLIIAIFKSQWQNTWTAPAQAASVSLGCAQQLGNDLMQWPGGWNCRHPAGPVNLGLATLFGNETFLNHGPFGESDQNAESCTQFQVSLGSTPLCIHRWAQVVDLEASWMRQSFPFSRLNRVSFFPTLSFSRGKVVVVNICEKFKTLIFLRK